MVTRRGHTTIEGSCAVNAHAVASHTLYNHAAPSITIESRGPV